MNLGWGSQSPSAGTRPFALPIRPLLLAFAMGGFLFVAACSDTNGALQAGGGSDSGQRGHVRLGLPF